ncbi:MAG: PEP-CTERM sorting domain-containing protein [Pseudomonadales bacterium]
MKRHSILLALTLVWGICFANISHATIIRFETVVIVDTVEQPAADLGLFVGQELNDVLVLDFSDGPTITDVANVVEFLGDGGLPLIPVEVDLTFADGELTGFLVGMIPEGILPLEDVFTRDDWVSGEGRLTITQPGPGGMEILGGTTVIRQVPEPTSLALLSLGVFGLGMVRRRRKV